MAQAGGAQAKFGLRVVWACWAVGQPASRSQRPHPDLAPIGFLLALKARMLSRVTVDCCMCTEPSRA